MTRNEEYMNNGKFVVLVSDGYEMQDKDFDTLKEAKEYYLSHKDIKNEDYALRIFLDITDSI